MRRGLLSARPAKVGTPPRALILTCRTSEKSLESLGNLGPSRRRSRVRVPSLPPLHFTHLSFQGLGDQLVSSLPQFVRCEFSAVPPLLGWQGPSEPCGVCSFCFRRSVVARPPASRDLRTSWQPERHHCRHDSNGGAVARHRCRSLNHRCLPSRRAPSALWSASPTPTGNLADGVDHRSWRSKPIRDQ